jgi:hypothetical protein
MIKGDNIISKELISKHLEMLLGYATIGDITKLSNGIMVMQILLEPLKDETFKRKMADLESQYKEIADKIELEQKTIKSDVTPLINHYMQEKSLETFKLIIDLIWRRL